MTKNTKAGGPRSGTAVLIGLAAIVVPLVPVAFWLRDVIQAMPGPVQSASFGLYLLARVAALGGFVLMFYQFVLTARVPFLEAALTRQRMLKRHRSLGKAGFLMVLSHGIIMLSLDPQLYTPKTLGLIALVVLSLAVVAAWFFKPLKLPLKIWRAIHLGGYIAFPLAFFHALLIGSTVRGYRPIFWLFIVLFALYGLILVNRLVRLIKTQRRARPNPDATLS